MSRGILALYDTTEIQKYVYSSNKLKDNIGASELVDKCFSEFLMNVIKEKYSNQLDKVKLNWDEDKKWTFKKNNELLIEVVYIGGGNALIAFANKNLWKEINYEFGKKLLKEARGLNFVTVYTEMTDSFKEDLDKLFKKINDKKYNYRKIDGVNGLSITKECQITKNTVAGTTEKLEDVSYEVFMKRQNSVENSDNKILDDIAGNKGESYIAVVHIDGNNMGKKVAKIASESNYSEAIETIREFSYLIKIAYKNAYIKTIKEFENVIFYSDRNDKLIKEYREVFTKKNRNIVPFREILIKGDDVTYICNGKIAISSLEKYFQYLKEELNKSELTKDLNACGGIVFIKPHFPFSEGYKIAEECCSSAKNKAKSIDEKNVGYYFDFHIVRGAMMGNLDEVRQAQYNTEEIDLLFRPFTLETSKKVTRKATNFDDVKILINQLKNSKIPRSKVKELRDAFIYGEEEVKLAISKMNSRGLNMTYKNKEVIDIERGVRVKTGTPLFDAIEFMELYDDLFEVEGDKQLCILD